MRRKRFKEEQIVKVLKEAERGQVPSAELCRRVRISILTPGIQWTVELTNGE